MSEPERLRFHTSEGRSWVSLVDLWREFGISRDIVRAAWERGEFVVGDIAQHAVMDESGVGEGIGYVVEFNALRQFLINSPDLVMADSRLMAFIDPYAYVDEETDRD